MRARLSSPPIGHTTNRFADVFEQPPLVVVLEVDGILDLDERRLVRIFGRVREQQAAGQAIVFGVAVVVFGIDVQQKLVQWLGGLDCATGGDRK